MISRGDIYYADLSPVIGSEQGGIRPVLVLQNNKGNKFSTTVIVANLFPLLFCNTKTGLIPPCSLPITGERSA